MPEQIKTLEEILDSHFSKPDTDIKVAALNAMREACELHVKRALTAAYHNVRVIHRGFEYTDQVDKNSIKNSYKPRHIK